MPRKQQNQDSGTDQSGTDSPPTFDVTQLELGIWLRQLLLAQYLLPNELIYFVITGAYATKDHKTVVYSLRHGLLLRQGYMHSKNYNVTNPPPMGDYDALYAQARAEGVALPINPTTADLPDNYPISPDRIKALGKTVPNRGR